LNSCVNHKIFIPQGKHAYTARICPQQGKLLGRSLMKYISAESLDEFLLNPGVASAAALASRSVQLTNHVNKESVILPIQAKAFLGLGSIRLMGVFCIIHKDILF
jgi:hypothetical protein